MTTALGLVILQAILCVGLGDEKDPLRVCGKAAQNRSLGSWGC